MAIQMRRGEYSAFDPTKIQKGEWAIVTSGDPNTEDGKAVYIGLGGGEVKRISTFDDTVNALYNAESALVDKLTTDIQDAVQEEISKQVSTSTNTSSTDGQTLYATCTSASSTTAKTATLASGKLTLKEGATVTVYFSNTNSAASPTLNIDSTGAKAIRPNAGTSWSSLYNWAAKDNVTFVYSGSYWVLASADARHAAANAQSVASIAQNGIVNAMKVADDFLVNDSEMGGVVLTDWTADEIGSNIQLASSNTINLRSNEDTVIATFDETGMILNGYPTYVVNGETYYSPLHITVAQLSTDQEIVIKAGLASLVPFDDISVFNNTNIVALPFFGLEGGSEGTILLNSSANILVWGTVTFDIEPIQTIEVVEVSLYVNNVPKRLVVGQLGAGDRYTVSIPPTLITESSLSSPSSIFLMFQNLSTRTVTLIGTDVPSSDSEYQTNLHMMIL